MINDDDSESDDDDILALLEAPLPEKKTKKKRIGKKPKGRKFVSFAEVSSSSSALSIDRPISSDRKKVEKKVDTFDVDDLLDNRQDPVAPIRKNTVLRSSLSNEKEHPTIRNRIVPSEPMQVYEDKNILTKQIPNQEEKITNSRYLHHVEESSDLSSTLEKLIKKRDSNVSERVDELIKSDNSLKENIRLGIIECQDSLSTMLKDVSSSVEKMTQSTNENCNSGLTKISIDIEKLGKTLDSKLESLDCNLAIKHIETQLNQKIDALVTERENLKDTVNLLTNLSQEMANEKDRMTRKFTERNNTLKNKEEMIILQMEENTTKMKMFETSRQIEKESLEKMKKSLKEEREEINRIHHVAIKNMELAKSATSHLEIERSRLDKLREEVVLLGSIVSKSRQSVEMQDLQIGKESKNVHERQMPSASSKFSAEIKSSVRQHSVRPFHLCLQAAKDVRASCSLAATRDFLVQIKLTLEDLSESR